MALTYPSSKMQCPEEIFPYRADIDGMRAVAVLAVLIYHAFPNLLPAGFIGVDIFFVISGFLISEILLREIQQNRFSLRYFYGRRIQRIFPSLIVVLSASLFLGWIYSLADEYKELGKHVAGASVFIPNILLWNESDYFDLSSVDKPLLHLWSLGIEAQFYLLWPLILWGTCKYHLPILKIIIFLTIVSFGLSLLSFTSNRVMSFYALQNRFWELSIGSLVAYGTLFGIRWPKSFFSYYEDSCGVRLSLWYRGHPELFCNMRAFAGLGFIILGFLLIHPRRFSGLPALLPTIGTALLISASSKAWLNQHILSNKIWGGLGLISFPLYLWHWLIISFGPLPSEVPYPIIVRVGLTCLSIFLAWLTYWFVEKPLRSQEHRQIKIWALIFSLLGIGCLGILVYEQDGFGFRFDGPVRAINQLSQITDVYKYFNYKSLLRAGICNSVTLEDTYKNHCIDKREKNIFLWGDSYAASLYAGLNYVRNKERPNYGISQMTDGNGPPFYDKTLQTETHKTLSQANQDRLSAVEQLQPDVIILSWMISGMNAMMPKEKALSALEFTISQIKHAAPSAKIIVFGPFPYWNGTLIKELVGFYRQNHLIPPVYMQAGLADSPKVWDAFFKESIPKLDVTYLSVYDALCNDNGCLTRTGDHPSDLTALDYGHLTQTGSIYVIEKLKNAIFTD